MAKYLPCQCYPPKVAQETYLAKAAKQIGDSNEVLPSCAICQRAVFAEELSLGVAQDAMPDLWRPSPVSAAFALAGPQQRRRCHVFVRTLSWHDCQGVSHRI
jgi:hypothetical protein